MSSPHVNTELLITWVVLHIFFVGLGFCLFNGNVYSIPTAS